MTYAVRFGAVILAASALLHLALSVFPVQSGLLGSDYRYFAPYLLAGEQWVRLNGWLSPPHFTGAFCGGMPWLANPQSLVWSLPQLLFIFLGPIKALLATYLITAAVGAGATYFLLRRPFALAVEAALLGAILFLLNSFLFARLAVGHLTYHTICLIPLIALTVMDGRKAFLRIVCAGVCFAVLVFGGALNAVVPVGLSVAALILLHQAGSGLRWRPWLLLAAGGLWGGGLAAIKLVPSFVLMLQFPRPYLGVALFAKWPAMLRMMAKAFFAPELLGPLESMGTGRIPLGHHELEFGIGIIPPLLILAGLFLLPRLKRISVAAMILLAGLLALPALLSCGSNGWALFLSHVPIINNNTMMTRWWMIYLLPLIALGMVCFDRLTGDPRRRLWALAIAAMVAAGQSWHRDLAYYDQINAAGFFDPSAVAAAHEGLAQGDKLPPIAALGQEKTKQSTDMSANEALMAGASGLPCYEPVFGYTLEQFPAKSLTVGPVETREDGTVNMADPRCYLGGCRSGAALAANDSDVLEALESYRPLPWRQPLWQRCATLVSAALAIATLLAAAAGAFRLSSCLYASARSAASDSGPARRR